MFHAKAAMFIESLHSYSYGWQHQLPEDRRDSSVTSMGSRQVMPGVKTQEQQPIASMSELVKQFAQEPHDVIGPDVGKPEVSCERGTQRGEAAATSAIVQLAKSKQDTGQEQRHKEECMQTTVIAAVTEKEPPVTPDSK